MFLDVAKELKEQSIRNERPSEGIPKPRTAPPWHYTFVFFQCFTEENRLNQLQLTFQTWP